MDRSPILQVVLLLSLVALAIVSRLIRAGKSSSSLRTPPLTPQQDAAIAEAAKLWKSDPKTAQLIVDGAFEKEGEREDEERAELRARAQTDRAAAEELRRRLREDLEVWETLLKGSRKKAATDTDERAQKGVANLETRQQETRAELAQVDDLIRRLKG
jgi:hypothetical protein